MRTGSKIITYDQPNIYGSYFRCSKRTAAHLDRTKARLKKAGCSLRIIQGSYNTSVEVSAGTHDFDAVLDVEVVGMTWYKGQRFLRQNGWAAWVREPPDFSYHIHMVSLPPFKTNFVARVGEYVPGQVDDYYAHLGGLIGYDPDGSWHPDNIRSTIFDYDQYLKESSVIRRISALTRRIRAARKARAQERRRLRRLRAK